jgi:hypothetical protein
VTVSIGWKPLLLPCTNRDKQPKAEAHSSCEGERAIGANEAAALAGGKT